MQHMQPQVVARRSATKKSAGANKAAAVEAAVIKAARVAKATKHAAHVVCAVGGAHVCYIYFTYML